MRDTKQLSAALLSLRRFNSQGAGKSCRNSEPRRDTKAPRRIACALLVLIVAVCGVYGLRGRFVRLAKTALNPGGIVPAVELAMTNPFSFAKSHVTGGIGAVVLADPSTGLPKIQMLVAGSPAQKAGLRPGDVILTIDGSSARGRTLAQNIECIRGLASISVALTIQRAGSTNLNCVIHRSSWSGMGIAQQ